MAPGGCCSPARTCWNQAPNVWGRVENLDALVSQERQKPHTGRGFGIRPGAVAAKLLVAAVRIEAVAGVYLGHTTRYHPTKFGGWLCGSFLMGESKWRRNADRRKEQRELEQRNAVARAEFEYLGSGSSASKRSAAELPLCRMKLETPPGMSARSAWIAWLSPVFQDNESCYFTGTYSDDYGYSNGLTLQRNVFKDFTRFMDSFGFDGQYIVGVERHQYRDILHLHGILAGGFTKEQRQWVKSWWESERGFARALPVLDGCASYVTKYALKGDTDSFEWRLES